MSYVVENSYLKDCEDLRSGRNKIFYPMRQKKYIYIHFEVIVSLGDQLERREVNYMVQGNLKFSSRYRFVTDISSILEYVSVCEEYRSKIKCEPK